MRKLVLLLICCLSLIPAVSMASDKEGSEVKKVLVLPFETNRYAKGQDLEKLEIDYLIKLALFREKRVKVIDNKEFPEMNIGKLNTSKNAISNEYSFLDYIIYGDYYQKGDYLVVNINLFDVKREEVIRM